MRRGPSLHRSSTIAGFHGAGLTNLMFRRGQRTRVGEIVMEHHIAPEYYVLSRHFGFGYQAMLGTLVDGGSEPRCRVDPQRLDEFLAALLASPGAARPASSRGSASVTSSHTRPATNAQPAT